MTKQYSHSTFVALWVGLGLTVAAIVGAQLGRPLIGEHLRSGYPSISHNEITSGVDFYATSLTTIGAIGLLPCAAGLIAVVLMFTRSANAANRNGAPMHRLPQARTE